MESGLKSRKRKQTSSKSDDAFGGIFTRSRSQIYFHRHRSGYARSDSNRSRNVTNSVKGRAQSQVKRQQSEARVSVIDLRARRVFSPATIADDVENVDEFDVHKKNLSFTEGELGVSDSVAVEVESNLENIGDLGVSDSVAVEEDVAEADVVQMTPIIAESEQNKRLEEKIEIISAANEIADIKGIMNKSQSSVTSLPGRKKIFKSPSSFSYRRMLSYLTESGNNDSPSFEIVEASLPKVLKSTNTTATMVACKDEKSTSKLVDELVSDIKSCEKEMLNSVNDGLITTAEGSDVRQRSQEDAVNDTLECEQMTPPDSDIFSKSKIDDIVGVPVNPKLKPALKQCARKKVLQTPTSFSHRRLLPFLMSVAEDNSCSVKSNQSLKPVMPTEQNQQPLTKSLLQPDEKSTTADETSNSPTSTLIPVDTSLDTTKLATFAPNDNISDANGLDKEGSVLVSQLDVSLQGEAVNSDNSIKMEQSPPKISLKCVEETTSKDTPLCIEQNYNVENQITVKESPHQLLVQITETHGESVKNGILKRTPRGCRGICNCLNCTSFRLHAERSFEFSKNQMHDAEEVALELINDLTSLRNILETTSSNSSSLDSVKEKQVKEACAKALYKEQVARARLAHMNEDLSIHCRSMTLLRPTVTFANKIQEKVISKDAVYGRKRV